jgi:thioredoxin 1
MTQTVLLVVALVIIAFFVLGRIAKTKIKNTPMVADHEKILTLTDKNFQQQKKNKIVLVDFWASWCAPAA